MGRGVTSLLLVVSLLFVGLTVATEVETSDLDENVFSHVADAQDHSVLSKLKEHLEQEHEQEVDEDKDEPKNHAVNRLVKLIHSIRERTIREGKQQDEIFERADSRLAKEIHELENKSGDQHSHAQSTANARDSAQASAKSLLAQIEANGKKISESNLRLDAIASKIKSVAGSFAVRLNNLDVQIAETKEVTGLMNQVAAHLTQKSHVEMGSATETLTKHAERVTSEKVKMMLETAALVSAEAEALGDMKELSSLLSSLVKELESQTHSLQRQRDQTHQSMELELRGLKSEQDAETKLRDGFKAESSRLEMARAEALNKFSQLSKKLAEMKDLSKSTTDMLKLKQKEQKDGRDAHRDALAHRKKQLDLLEEIEEMLHKKKGGLSSALATRLASLRPTLAVWNVGDWSMCSRSCGDGVQTRTVQCSSRSPLHPCPKPKPATSRKCFNAPCPVHCRMSSWSQWGACSAKCGGGRQTRSRTILTNPQFGGTACPTQLVESQNCNLQPCVASWQLKSGTVEIGSSNEGVIERDVKFPEGSNFENIRDLMISGHDVCCGDRFNFDVVHKDKNGFRVRIAREGHRDGWGQNLKIRYTVDALTK